MLGDDRTDRRGFWRYFDSDPTAYDVVTAVLATYTSEGPLDARQPALEQELSLFR